MENTLKTIYNNNLIQSKDVVAVACSGGADSIALLHKLYSLKNELNSEIIAVTIDHSLRENSSSDAQFVMDFCKSLNIRCYTFKIDVNKLAIEKGLSTETAAREARYKVFDSLIEKGIATKIALAHHKQDQAETILLHLFRGSGLAGIKGMEYNKNNAYIRPMLDVNKEQIYKYIKDNNLSYVTDETNNESTYTRNYLRNEIFPLIEKKWPNIVNSLINFSKSASQDDEYINKNINDDAVIIDENVAKIPLSYFLYDEPILVRIIFRALHKIGINVDIEKKHINSIISLAKNSENGKKINLPLKVCVYKEYEYIVLTNRNLEKKVLNRPFKCEEFTIENIGKISVKRVKSCKFIPNVLYLDYRKLPKDAIWRFKQPGDIFEKFGGGTKKLKDYFIDKKIPLRERETLPVLASNNEIFAIAGLEISDKVKLSGDEKSIIKIEYRTLL